MEEGEFSEARGILPPLRRTTRRLELRPQTAREKRILTKSTKPSLFGVCLLFFWEEVPCLELTLWCEVDAYVL